MADSYCYPPSEPKRPPLSEWSPLTQEQIDWALVSNPARAFTVLRQSITGGLDQKRILIRGLVGDLPAHCREAAANILAGVASIPQITAKTIADKPVAVVARELQLNRRVYVGITERPVARFDEHSLGGYSKMALWALASSAESASHEKHLIATYRANPLLQNIGAGGERASHAQPHFLYVVSQS